jgi:predicted phosphodiesterase
VGAEESLRVAVVSDIHGNRTAFHAVVEDLRQMAPDLVLHAGDLADGGSSPAEIVDQIRDLGWLGVMGNTDQILCTPEAFEEFAAHAPHLDSLWSAIREMAAFTRELLGEERLAWLGQLPERHSIGELAIVHASPGSCWRAPFPESADDELGSVYAVLARPLAVYGHIHRPFIREIGGLTVMNAGSVGLPYDGDPRASYLLMNGSQPQIRRVEYDVDAEIGWIERSGIPHAAWVANMLCSAAPRLP